MTAPQLTQQAQQSPPEGLRAHFGWDGATWTPLGGGRSNKIWKISGAGRTPLVCKLYALDRGNHLFPNDAEAEALALQSLTGSGLAPEFVARISTRDQTALAYRFVDGRTGPDDGKQVGRLLARLHTQRPPTGLRRVACGSGAIRESAEHIAQGLKDASALPPAPQVPELPFIDPVFLHGDPVPANMVQSEKGLCLIDWQCPALGDPAEDLFVFLSPSMQHLYGAGPLAPEHVRACLAGYGNPKVIDRLKILSPLLHWRMAAYCLWMAEKGARDYGPAAAFELASLARIRGA